MKVYDECDHENCAADPIELYDFTTCADSLMGYACGTCCRDSDFMADDCPHGLDHTGTTRTTYCPTVVAARGE